MTSKIFKSSYMSDSSRLEIETSIASTSFHITHCTVVSEKSFRFDNTTAPVLALAILEAAGVESVSHRVTGLGKPNWLEGIAHGLKLHIEHEAMHAAEAKEQAELEAEALELFKTLMGVKGYENFTWSEVASKDEWLAVARKAREMSAEK